MDFTDLSQAPTPILVALACNAVGFVIKKSVIENKWIPILLMLAGAGMYIGIEGATVRHLTEGFVIGAGSVGFNQLVKQHFPGEPEQSPGT